jgi:hypothetical protein
LAGFADGELACFLMFKWGKDERESHIMARAFGYAAEGQQQNWLYLQQLGQKEQGLFWDVPSEPGAFHDLQANVPELYDAAVDRNGAFAGLGVDTYLVAAGTWVSKDQGAVSSAWFDDFELTGDAPDAPSHAGGQPLKTDASVFQCEFGQELADRIARNRER